MQFVQEVSTNSNVYPVSNSESRYKSALSNLGRGLRIKFHRIDQGLSLKEIAAGNLSQENLRLAEMSQFPIEDKVYKKLCMRLGIPMSPIVNPMAETSILKLKSMLTHIKSRQEIIEEFVRMQSYPKSHMKEIYWVELMIHSIRYHIVTGDVSSALEKYSEAEKYKELMNSEQLFFLRKYRGNIHYSEGQYRSALNCYLGCLTSAPLDLPTPEMADLLYSLGITSAQLVEPQGAMGYCQKALTFYQEMFYPKRLVECHVAISLAEHRVRNFKSGMSHLEKAAMILDEVDLPNLRYLVEYNFGYSYFQFQDFEATIRHMETCLSLIEDGNVIEELRCYTTLMKANLELNRKDAALNWCDLGTTVLRDMETSSLSNPSVFEIFNQFHLLKSLLYGNHDRFEYLAEEEVLPHFEKNGYDIDHAYYCTLVADHYNRVGKASHATRLYQKAGEIYRKVISIN